MISNPSTQVPKAHRLKKHTTLTKIEHLRVNCLRSIRSGSTCRSMLSANLLLMKSFCCMYLRICLLQAYNRSRQFLLNHHENSILLLSFFLTITKPLNLLHSISLTQVFGFQKVWYLDTHPTPLLIPDSTVILILWPKARCQSKLGRTS